MTFNVFGRRKIWLNNKESQGHVPIPADLDESLSFIKGKLGESPDVVYRSFMMSTRNKRAAIVYVDGLADSDVVNLQVMESIFSLNLEEATGNDNNLLDLLVLQLLPIGHISLIHSGSELTPPLLRGDTLLLLDNCPGAVSISSSGGEMRSIMEPSMENEVRGPRESFVEDIRTNRVLVRRKIKDESLRFLQLKLGKISQTEVSLAYIQGMAEETLVMEIKKRIEDIHVDGMLESFYIEEWISDHPYSPFPQIDHTERPDKVAGRLLEGHVAILVDGSPWALIAPTVFFQLFSASGDYYINYYFATFLRWIRFLSFLFALAVPSLYIALITIHQEMFPTPLALRLAGARSGVPFPAIVEAFMMELAFEILREAGIRLPKVAGQAVSIVGALIIGQAAVEAGIVSPVMVIVVALTGISSFAIPRYSLGMAIRLIRFPLMILASIAGIPGITVALLAILTYIASIKSFGVNYLSPVAPFTRPDMKDTLYRAPWWSLESARHRFVRRQQSTSEFEMEDLE